jgi:hypothetical protein
MAGVKITELGDGGAIQPTDAFPIARGNLTRFIYGSQLLNPFVDINNKILQLSAADSQFVKRSGDEMSGFLTLNSNPTQNLHAVPKQYVDNFQTSSGLSYAVESSFVYSARMTGSGTANLSNRWQDVFIDRNLSPMRVTFTSPSVAKVAFITAKMHISNIDNPWSSWFRLGRFEGPSRINYPVPTQVLDVDEVQGHVSYSESNMAYLNAVVNLQPNTSYTFGLQSYFYASGTYRPSSVMVVNGWHDAVGDNRNANNPSNILAVNALTNWYAESPSTNPTSPTTNIQIGNSNTPARDRLKVSSFVRVVLI